MTQQLYKRKRPDFSDETGAYIIISLFVIVALLALAALGIDTANLYHRRMQMQKAVDAGVLHGLNYRIIGGAGYINALYDGTALPSGIANPVAAIELSTRNAITANLEAIGFDPTKATITTKYEYKDAKNAVIDKLRADISYTVDLYIMNAIPFEVLGVRSTAFKTVNVKATSTAELNAANLSLMYDVSGSMGCTSDALNCNQVIGVGGTSTINCTAGSCNPTQAMKDAIECADPANFPSSIMPGGGTGTFNEAKCSNYKIAALYRAMALFLSKFRNGRDRVSLIPFQFVSSLVKTMRDPFNYLQWVTAMREVGIGGNTNISDALLTAYEDFLRADDSIKGSEVNYILFTDGAPTATRLLLDDDTINEYVPAGNSASDTSRINGFNSNRLTTWDYVDCVDQNAQAPHCRKIDLSAPDDATTWKESDDKVQDVLLFKMNMPGPGGTTIPQLGPIIYTPPLGEKPLPADLFASTSKDSIRRGVYENNNDKFDGKEWNENQPAWDQGLNDIAACSFWGFPGDPTTDADLFPSWMPASGPARDTARLHYCSSNTDGSYSGYENPANSCHTLYDALNTVPKERFINGALQRCVIGVDASCSLLKDNRATQMSDILAAWDKFDKFTSRYPERAYNKCFPSSEIRYHLPGFQSAHLNKTLYPKKSGLGEILPGAGAHNPASQVQDMQAIMRQFYNSSVAYADLLRQNKGNIYAIGLGAGDCPNSTVNDPYQNVLQDFNRKDYFLSRLSWSPNFTLIAKNGAATTSSVCNIGGSATGQQAIELNKFSTNDNNLAQYNPLITNQSTRQFRSGNYVATTDVQYIKKIFDHLARKILLKRL